MATISHRLLAGSQIHEPKGIDLASAGTVYVADGAASGNWQSLPIPSGKFTIRFVTFTSSGTWTKPTDLIYVKVLCQGSGGLGGGIVGINGYNGPNVSFGSHMTANGGGLAAGTTPGSGGSVTGADFGGSGIGGSPTQNGGLDPGIVTPTRGPFPPYGYGFAGGTSFGTGAGGGTGAWGYKYISANLLGATETVTFSNTGLTSHNGLCLIEEYILD